MHVCCLCNCNIFSNVKPDTDNGYHGSDTMIEQDYHQCQQMNKKIECDMLKKNTSECATQLSHKPKSNIKTHLPAAKLTKSVQSETDEFNRSINLPSLTIPITRTRRIIDLFVPKIEFPFHQGNNDMLKKNDYNQHINSIRIQILAASMCIFVAGAVIGGWWRSLN